MLATLYWENLDFDEGCQTHSGCLCALFFGHYIIYLGLVMMIPKQTSLCGAINMKL